MRIPIPMATFLRETTSGTRGVVDSSRSPVAGGQTSGCTVQVAPSLSATNCTNDGSGACAFRISYYSANVRGFAWGAGIFTLGCSGRGERCTPSARTVPHQGMLHSSLCVGYLFQIPE